MAQQRQVLHGVCETVGWRHRRLGMQTFKHLRLLVHRCAHRFASPLAAAAVAAAIAADVAFRPLPFQHRLWMCRPKEWVVQQSDMLHRVCAWEWGRLRRDFPL